MHSKGFKNECKTIADMRKKRSEFFEKLRKNKRFKELVKRRNINIDITNEDVEMSSDSIDDWMEMMVKSGNFDLLESEFFNECKFFLLLFTNLTNVLLF